jgi:hypothetical protein
LQLDDLLKDCGRHRVLAAAFWHHHSYWFRRLNQMFGRRVPKALERMVSWKIEDATMRRTLEREVRRTQAALERLSSGRYGRPLERFVSH